MILVLNGPNLNMLGTREPETYGRATLADLEAACVRRGQALNVSVTCRQSNYEGQLLEWLHAAADEGFTGLIINPGGLTHTSVALRDAVVASGLPAVEVHLSNIYAREAFRHHSYLSAVCLGTVAGLGFQGYQAALTALAEQI